ncbi:hypothetical protein OTU49_013243 [Cherax quadricarinatus]|uniref:Uncharacterized protein n=2 Tax=Cherax quadricarinatus TaxID=27406 RepID=A0AAW0VUA0_CHEQU
MRMLSHRLKIILILLLVQATVWVLSSTSPGSRAHHFTHPGTRGRHVGMGGPSRAMDPRKSRNTRQRADLNAKMELYRQRFKDDEGCVQHPSPPNSPTLPTVPDSFITELEISFLNTELQYVMYGQEMYNGIEQRGVLDYYLAEGMIEHRPFLLAELMHYNILLDEALFIITNDGCEAVGLQDCDTATACVAGSIDDLNTEIQQLFGIVSIPGEHGFMGAAGLLEFGSQFNYSARPVVDQCHGLNCYVFETCLNDPAEDAEVLYVYYWSTEDWNVRNDGKQVPIAVEMYATGKYNGASVQEVMVRYDFFDFRRDWVPSRDELEPPANVYCAGRKTYIDPPQAVPFFFYNTEVVVSVDIAFPDGDNQTTPFKFSLLYPTKVWYDWTMKITKKEFVPITVFNSTRRYENYTTVIHEFNQGLAYVIRKRLSFCSVNKIENNITWADVKVDSDGTVSMQSPWNFEEMDQEMQYNGAHWERGMRADVWVGIKKNQLFKINETYVWYFASPMTSDLQGSAPTVPVITTTDKVPIKLERYMTELAELPHLSYNFYGYDSQVPTTHHHDISPCYSSDHMRHFQFAMPPDTLNKTLYKRENVMYALVEALSATGKVTPLRINRMEIKELQSELQVLFTLLEKPTVAGDPEFPISENTMNQAADLIQKTIDKSQLVAVVQITSGLEPQMVQVVAMPGTLKEVQRDDGHTRGTNILTGYSPGDMAGLAIGMLILGGIVGYAGIYIYASKK